MSQLAFHHVLVGLSDLIKSTDFTQAWIYAPGPNKVIVRDRLDSICSMGALKPLLSHPMIAKIDNSRVACRARANDDHPATLTAEN
jgi:hypothetical protein